MTRRSVDCVASFDKVAGLFCFGVRVINCRNKTLKYSKTNLQAIQSIILNMYLCYVFDLQENLIFRLDWFHVWPSVILHGHSSVTV